MAADGALVVTDIAPTVLHVDPRSGNRTIVSDATTGLGPPLHNPASIAVAADGTLIVADPGLFDPLSGVTLIPPTLLRVDLRSGNRTIVSDATTGLGPPLQPPASIAVAADGALIVAGLGLFDLLSGTTLIPPTLFRVDPRSGNRTPISGCFDSHCTNIVGSGPPLLVPVGLAVETNGSLVVANSRPRRQEGTYSECSLTAANALLSRTLPPAVARPLSVLRPLPWRPTGIWSSSTACWQLWCGWIALPATVHWSHGNTRRLYFWRG